MTLNLGVLDVAYSGDTADKATTTGAVAEILEEKYEVMGTFFGQKKEWIANIMAEYMADYIQDIMSGMRPNRDPFMDAMQEIETAFRIWLDADEWSKLRPHGMGIRAAQKGHSKRFKDEFNSEGKRDARPAFVDSGLFQASFRAWIDGAPDKG